MTTNKPEIVAWRWRKPVVNDQGEAVGVTNWKLSKTPGLLPWWTNEPLVRLSDYESLQAECDALRTKTSVSLGVGDGDGNLFVHGDYDSIKRVQELIFECEKLRGDVLALVEALAEARHHVVISPDIVRGNFIQEIDDLIAAHRRESNHDS